MKLLRRTFLWAAFVFPAACLAGCGAGGSGPTAARSSTPTSTPAPTASAVVRVACVRDSITFGIGTFEPLRDAYPLVVGRWLGSGFEVRNFGVSATTLLQAGALPYQQQSAFTQALRFKPNIVTIALGTNDSAMTFDSALHLRFISDYKEMISSFKKANADVKVYVCLPIPSQPEDGQRNTMLVNDVIPCIEQVARDTGAQVIDLHTPFVQRPELYFDNLHPNNRGANLIAAQVYRALTGMDAPTAG